MMTKTKTCVREEGEGSAVDEEEPSLVQHIRFCASDLNRLDELGDTRANHVRAAVAQYLKGREDSRRLEEVESRLAATLVRLHGEVHELRQDHDVALAMIDRLVRFVMYTTPEIDDKDAAMVTGHRRYNGYRNNLAQDLKGKKRQEELDVLE